MYSRRKEILATILLHKQMFIFSKQVIEPIFLLLIENKKEIIIPLFRLIVFISSLGCWFCENQLSYERLTNYILTAKKQTYSIFACFVFELIHLLTQILCIFVYFVQLTIIGPIESSLCVQLANKDPAQTDEWSNVGWKMP